MRVIGLCGYAQTGKDTIGKFLVENQGYTRVSFADPLREALYALNPLLDDELRVVTVVDSVGWEYAKNAYPEIRQLLQRFGTEVGRTQFGEHFWADMAAAKARQHNRVVFTDVRFQSEVDVVYDLFGEVWRIDRPGVGPVNDHQSDRLDIPIDRIINNDGDLDSLFAKVTTLLRSME